MLHAVKQIVVLFTPQKLVMFIIWEISQLWWISMGHNPNYTHEHLYFLIYYVIV